MTATRKILTVQALREVCSAERERGRRIVFTNGCFDILHVGHVRYLEEARRQGDLLVVAVNSDESVKQIKGPLRPVVQERERSELVAALECVDYVVLFHTPTPLPLIEALRPSVLVKGADWPLDRIAGADFVLRNGGEVVRIPVVPGCSTSDLIQRIVERFHGVASSAPSSDPSKQGS